MQPQALKSAPAQLSDQSVEQFIGHLLRIGVLVAAATVIFGGALYLSHHATEMPAYHVFRGEPAPLRDTAGTVRSAMTGDPAAIMQLGILLLIATPVMRVLFSIYAFWKQRDVTYVLITLFVLAILMFGLMSR
jgi:uncharacterized membrane protein